MLREGGRGGGAKGGRDKEERGRAAEEGGEIRKIDEQKHGGYLENRKRCEQMKEGDKTERY